MIQGGCCCGRVRYEAEADPFHETLCHCSDCRKAIGAHVVGWISIPVAALRFSGDEPAFFRSSSHARRGFCRMCGTSLTFQDDDVPGQIDITTVSLDEPDRFPPRDHIRTRHKLGWDEIADGLPVFLDGRTG